MSTPDKNYFVTSVKISAFRELIIKLLYLTASFGVEKERPDKSEDFG